MEHETSKIAGQVTFRWHIANFSACAHDFGNALTSAHFTAFRSTRWTLAIYPRGSNDRTCLSLALKRCSNETGVMIKRITCSAEFALEEVVPPHVRVLEGRQFEKGQEEVMPDFIKRALLMEKGYLADDVLKIRCVLKMVEEPVIRYSICSNSHFRFEEGVCVWSIERLRKNNCKPHPDVIQLEPGNKELIITAEAELEEKEGEKWAIFQLRATCLSLTSEKVISIRLTVMDKGKETRLSVRAFGTVSDKFAEDDPTPWLFPNAFKLAELEPYFDEDGILLMQVKITMKTGPYTFKTEWVKPRNPPDLEIPSSLPEDMARMLESERWTDAVLHARCGKQLRVHRAVLAARAPELLDETKWSDLPFELLRNLVRFAYTGTCAIDAAPELSTIPHLSIRGVKLCTMIAMSEESPFKALLMAHEEQDEEMWAAVVGFVARKWRSFALSEPWMQFTVSHPEVEQRFRNYMKQYKMFL